MKFFLLIFFPIFIQGQVDWKKKELPAFENIYSEKIAEDSLQSTFFIAIKKQVIHHYHKEHSECIVVLSGKGKMTLGEQKIKLRAGIQVSIPKNTIHSVVVTSKKPLKVISIQSPMFDGKDRFFVEWSDF
ncbi:MAG: cupin domain-containing protein [Bacteroidetes bacterium]|nr:cupin domain-containing protein [Bacteroidota bacterium]